MRFTLKTPDLCIRAQKNFSQSSGTFAALSLVPYSAVGL
jgi:hypothetical protein